MAGLSLLWRNSMSDYLVWHDIYPVVKLETDSILDASTGLAI